MRDGEGEPGNPVAMPADDIGARGNAGPVVVAANVCFARIERRKTGCYWFSQYVSPYRDTVDPTAQGFRVAIVAFPR
jgi:hypothetical protein